MEAALSVQRVWSVRHPRRAVAFTQARPCPAPSGRREARRALRCRADGQDRVWPSSTHSLHGSAVPAASGAARVNPEQLKWSRATVVENKWVQMHCIWGWLEGGSHGSSRERRGRPCCCPRPLLSPTSSSSFFLPPVPP